MIRKYLAIFTVSAAYFVQAQDVSTIRNTAEIYSNNSFNGSAKYQSMACSMGALGGDVSSVNSNPAGIGVFITGDISGTLSIQNIQNATSFNSVTKDYKISDANLGQIGGVAVFPIEGKSPWKFVNLGVNYSNQNIEDYSETSGNENISFDFTTPVAHLAFLGHAYDRVGTKSKMTIAIGGNYDNKIYVGAALNFHDANFDQHDTAYFSTKITSNGTTTNSVESFSKQYTPFSEDSNGFSVSLGVIGKINNQLRFGAALETPTWWTIRRVFDFYNDSQYGDGNSPEDRKLASPMKATLSAAFVPNKNFAINVDYSIGVTKPKYKVYGPAETDLNKVFSDNYKNLSEVKVGAEYRIQGFRLRGGYGFSSNPFKQINVTSISNSGTDTTFGSDQFFTGKRNTIGAGLGYDFKSFYIDAAYQNIKSEYDNPFLYGNTSENSNYFSTNFILPDAPFAISHVKNTQNNFFLTLGWKF